VDGIDDEPTVLSLLARLVGQMAMWDAATHDRPYDIEAERSETLEDVRAKLIVGPAFLDQVRAIVAEGRLDETFVDALCDPPEIFTYGGMIAHVCSRSPRTAACWSAALSRTPASRTWARATR
jgi:AraC family transcriptional regulator